MPVQDRQIRIELGFMRGREERLQEIRGERTRELGTNCMQRLVIWG